MDGYQQELLDEHDRAVDRLRLAARVLVVLAFVSGVGGVLLGVALINRNEGAAGGYLIGSGLMTGALVACLGFWALLYASARAVESSKL